MASPHAIVITMSQSWRGKQEEFSNVMVYDPGQLINTDQGWRDAAAQVAAKLKEFHGSGVQFLRYKVWGPTNDPNKANRVIRVDGTLTGAGAILSGTVIPPEMAVVANWYIGRNRLGARNRYLRSYFHVGMLAGTGQEAAGRGVATIGASDLATLKQKANDLKTLTVGAGSIDRCSPDGTHLPVGTDATIVPYLHNRQFRA